MSLHLSGDDPGGAVVLCFPAASLAPRSSGGWDGGDGGEVAHAELPQLVTEVVHVSVLVMIVLETKNLDQVRVCHIGRITSINNLEMRDYYRVSLER